MRHVVVVLLLGAALAGRAGAQTDPKAAAEAARAAAEKAAAAAGDFRLYGENGRVAVELGAAPRVFSYSTQGGRAPVTLTLEYPRVAQAQVNGGFYEVAGTSPVTLAGVDRSALRTTAPQPATRTTSVAAASVRKSVTFTPPRTEAAARASYAQLVVRARDGAGTEKVLTLTVDVTRPAGLEGFFTGFNPGATQHTWLNTYLAANASCLADQDPPDVAATLRRYGFSQAPTMLDDQILHLTGYAVSDDRMVLIVVRGTDAMHASNLATDARFRLVGAAPSYASRSDAAIHSGFRTAADSLWRHVRNYLTANGTAANGSRKKVWVVGHSLGAALATLLGSRISLQMPEQPVQGVYAFAPPSVGDAEFKADYNSRLGSFTYRYINGADPVPRALVAPIYWGVGNLAYIDHAAPHRIRYPTDDFESYMTGHFALAPGQFARHDVREYVTRIHGNRPESVDPARIPAPCAVFTN